MQDFTGVPFHITVHAPHLPTTHPKCVPVRRRVSRRKWASSVRGSTSPEHGFPFTVREIVLSTSRLRRVPFLDQVQDPFRRERCFVYFYAQRAQSVFHRVTKHRGRAQHPGLSR